MKRYRNIKRQCMYLLCVVTILMFLVILFKTGLPQAYLWTTIQEITPFVFLKMDTILTDQFYARAFFDLMIDN